MRRPRVDTQLIDDYLLRYGPNTTEWEGIPPLRQALARQGPDLIPLLMDRACAALTTLGAGISPTNVMSWVSERRIQMLAGRFVNLVADLCDAPRGGYLVAAHLLRDLKDRSRIGKRALAAFAFNAAGVDYGSAVESL